MFLGSLLLLACGSLPGSLSDALSPSGPAPTPLEVPEGDLTIVHTAHMEGEFEPCG